MTYANGHVAMNYPTKTKQTTRMVFHLQHLRSDMIGKLLSSHGKSRDCTFYWNEGFIHRQLFQNVLQVQVWTL